MERRKGWMLVALTAVLAPAVLAVDEVRAAPTHPASTQPAVGAHLSLGAHVPALRRTRHAREAAAPVGKAHRPCACLSRATGAAAAWQTAVQGGALGTDVAPPVRPPVVVGVGGVARHGCMQDVSSVCYRRDRRHRRNRACAWGGCESHPAARVLERGAGGGGRSGVCAGRGCGVDGDRLGRPAVAPPIAAGTICGAGGREQGGVRGHHARAVGV